MAIIFTWLGTVTLAFGLAMVLGKEGFVLGLWASGAIGLLVGLMWARRHPGGGQHVLRGKPVRWWVLGGVAFALLGVGLWLAWQSANDATPPNLRTGFWPWLAHTVGFT